MLNFFGRGLRAFVSSYHNRYLNHSLIQVIIIVIVMFLLIDLWMNFSTDIEMTTQYINKLIPVVDTSADGFSSRLKDPS